MDSEADIIRGIGQKKGYEKWVHISDLIQRWKNRNPYGFKINELYNQDRRENLKNKEFGKLENEAMAGGRLTLSVHPELIAYIETFYPKFFENKENTREFAKRYKMFRISDKV